MVHEHCHCRQEFSILFGSSFRFPFYAYVLVLADRNIVTPDQLLSLFLALLLAFAVHYLIWDSGQDGRVSTQCPQKELRITDAE